MLEGNPAQRIESFGIALNQRQILTNVALLGISMLMLGLQRVFYGPLRPIEVEQLYEKAWFAITETCLAMTIFREEVGARFLVMFVSLLIGKVWGWIGEGRVEILEQQPPANPRLFHAQLSLSLLISAAFDSFMLQYSVNTVLRHARPNMMVMFAFEFAVLTVTSLSTAARYGISVYESRIIKNQIKERRSQLRVEREQARSQETASAEPSGDLAATPASDDDIESMEIDTPGWEDKGRWIFYLDLATGKLHTEMMLGRLNSFLLYRLFETGLVHYVFLRSLHVLRHADSHNSGCRSNYTVLLQTNN